MGTLERSARVWLFHLKHLQGQRGSLSFNITREVCEYLADPLLIHVDSTFLRFYNFGTSTWGPQVQIVSRNIPVDGSSRWVMLEGRVFCCGGWHIAAAYILARDGGVEQKAHMSVAREVHGLQAINNTAYVFGGWGEETCEKWRENKWTNLPSMSRIRCYFNPCILGRRMYLCGCSESMEAFDPQTDTFLPLLVTFPEDEACCLYVDNHLLVIHSDSYILKFAVEPDGQLAKRTEVRAPRIHKWQNSQPVVDQEKGVFYMTFSGICRCYDMETGTEGPTIE